MALKGLGGIAAAPDAAGRRADSSVTGTRPCTRHVDVHRALSLAPLAGEAEFQGFQHFPAFPAVLEEILSEHLKKQVRTPTRGVLLLSGRLEARAHEGVVGPLPTPTQRRVAAAKLPPSAGKRKWVSGCQGA